MSSAEALDLLVAKLAPLAQLDGDTVAKLVENIDNLAKLSIAPRVSENNKEGHPLPKNPDLDLNTLLYSCHSVQDIITKFQEFEYEADLGGFICCLQVSRFGGSEVECIQFQM